MALIPCYECGEPVSTLARACAQCGAPQQAVNAPAEARPPMAPLTTPPPQPIVNFSPAVQDEVLKIARVGLSAALGWVFFAIFLPSAIPLHIASLSFLPRSPFATLFVFLLALGSFREWLKRRTARAILKRKKLPSGFLPIYLSALWSFLWRSGLTFLGIGLLFTIGAENPEQVGSAIGVVLAMWLFPLPFILDVPFWVRRRVRRIVTNTPTPGEETVIQYPAQRKQWEAHGVYSATATKRK
jgi:hypothetical protein